MKTLLLIDGSSYLYRAFHAMPDLRSPDGRPTGVIYGMATMLRRMQKENQFDYSACIFDAKGKTFRDVLYSDYKAHRPPMPDELVCQIESVHEMVQAFGWPILVVEGVEADDVIGTLARQAEEANMRVLISTGDKDISQLVSKHITLVNTMTNEWLDEAGVQEKFGVPPAQIIDYLTLIGDKVDNVPGVDKCGPKTAAKWLEQYGSLDAIIDSSSKMTGKVGENLRAVLDWLPTGRRLITIKCDVDLSCWLPDGLQSLWHREPDCDHLARLFKEWGFKSLYRECVEGTINSRARVDRQDNASGVQCCVPHGTSLPSVLPRHYENILTESQLEGWLARLMSVEVVALDTETDSLDPLSARLVGISFSVEPGYAAYLPLGHRYVGVPTQLPFAATLARLAPWLEDPNKKKVGQHLKYDRHVFANHGITLRGVIDDTLLASYVLESHERHNMDDLAQRHLGETTLTYEDVCGKGVKQICFSQVNLAVATRYAAEDADITLRLNQAFAPMLQGKLAQVYRQIELPVTEVLFAMERHGVLVDRQYLVEQSERLGQEMEKIEQRAYELAGQTFNLNSPKQLQDILFGKLGISTQGVKKTATGGFSTNEDVLAKLALDYPLPRCLLDYRGLAKLKSSYTDKLPRLIRPETGRVHTHYAQAVAVTGRLASADPNLQNIPIRTVQGRRIREAFIAPPNYVIVSADYSQIELRIMAHLSDDSAMLKAFAEGHDIHRATASEVFGSEMSAITSEQRRIAKTINFGLIYGMSAFGLASQLGIERRAAEHYISRYFMRYPGIAQYMQSVREIARQQGYVETVFGRRLYVPDIHSSNVAKRAAAERAAINAPMQGTAADLIKLAMVAVYQWLQASQLASKLIMQVHDELVLEVAHEELERVRTALPQLMADVAMLKVPLLAEVGVGKSWGEAH